MAEEQVLVVDMRLKDNLTGPLAAAKQSVVGVGDASVSAAAKTEAAFGGAAASIRAKFAGLGADLKAGLGLGLGIGGIQLAAQATAALTGFLKESITAATEEAAGIAQLTQSLEANVPAWDHNTKAIEDLVQGRQKLAFSDGELRSSLATIVAATHDVNQAFAVQATAMDLARFKNISLAEASDALTKVEAGSFRILKSLGIVLADNATQTDALAAVQRVAGGQATAFGATTAAAMDRAGIAVRNLQEDLGRLADPGIKVAAEGIDKIVSRDLPSFADNSSREIGELDKALRFLGSPLGNLADLWRSNNAAVGLAGQGFDKTAATIGDFDIAAHAAKENTDTLGAAAKDAGFSITNLGVDIGKVTGDTDVFARVTLGAAEALKKFNWEAGQAQAVRNILAQPGLMLGGNPNDAASNASLGEHNAKVLQDNATAAEKLAAAQAAADAARTKGLADAKTAAAAYADLLANKLDAALRKEKDTATTLFDALHARHLQAISDTEKLAEKQHSATTQAIDDALKLRLAANAAPANEAEARQNQIELSRQRRDLGAALQTAQQGGDPLAIRNASEALQSFNASQRINSLRETQAKLDVAAQEQARVETKAADDKLNAAKVAQADALEAENKRAKKQRDDFDRALDALRIRDKGATPDKVRKDISDLERKFGITRDAQGHSHIEDPLVTAIKDVFTKPPIFAPNITYQPPVFAINGRLLMSYIVSAQSPTATPGVRTGAATPKAAG